MKKILTIFLAFQIVLFPYQQSKAFVPIAVAAPYAVDVVGGFAIRHLASEIGIRVIASTITNSIRFSNTARISYNTLATWLSSNAKTITGGTAIAAALGFAFTTDGTLGFSESGDSTSGNYPVKGFYWSGSLQGSMASTAKEAADIVASERVDSYDEVILSTIKDSTDDQIYYDVIENRIDSNGEQYPVRRLTFSVNKRDCTSETLHIATCSENFEVPVREATQQEIIDHFIKQSPSVLTEQQQLNIYSNQSGEIYPDLAQLAQVESLPKTLSGQELPERGDPLWIGASHVANGLAQSNDSSMPNYVPEYMWDEAYYLANTVSNSNTQITDWNANVDDNDGISPPVDGDISGEIGGIGDSLDGVLDSLDEINNSDVDIIDSPDNSKASSFWDVRYPDGIEGVTNDFISNIKTTDLFNWLNGFNLNLNDGTEPVFEFCFNTIASIDFGCLSLQVDSYIWKAINAMMILSSLIVSRRIVFGG